MRNLILFILACVWAALIPFRSGSHGAAAGSTAAPSWPTHWEGRPLRPLPLTAQETGFAAAFPGSMARFTDGSVEILFRRVDAPTRKLHPSSDCLRASGYSIKPLPAETAAHGGAWSCFLAKRKGESLRVRERVVTGNGAAGPSWTDVSSWYWNALWGGTQGPWTAITVSVRI